jgi:ubiquinol-cytochrome c reductase cytochrome b subunit
MSGLVEINPVWLYGPASSAEASAGSQPDWYMAFLDGSLRLVPPGWEVVVRDRSVPLALLVPQAVVAIFIGLIVLWPFVERRVPHGAATRAGLGAAGLAFYLCLSLAASTDIMTTEFGFAFESQVLVLRSLLVLGPATAFVLTRELYLAASTARRENASHGFATGQVVREPGGGYAEVHAQPMATEPALSPHDEPTATRAEHAA